MGQRAPQRSGVFHRGCEKRRLLCNGAEQSWPLHRQGNAFAFGGLDLLFICGLGLSLLHSAAQRRHAQLQGQMFIFRQGGKRVAQAGQLGILLRWPQFFQIGHFIRGILLFFHILWTLFRRDVENYPPRGTFMWKTCGIVEKLWLTTGFP